MGSRAPLGRSPSLSHLTPQQPPARHPPAGLYPPTDTRTLSHSLSPSSRRVCTLSFVPQRTSHSSAQQRTSLAEVAVRPARPRQPHPSPTQPTTLSPSQPFSLSLALSLSLSLSCSLSHPTPFPADLLPRLPSDPAPPRSSGRRAHGRALRWLCAGFARQRGGGLGVTLCAARVADDSALSRAPLPRRAAA